MTRHNFEFVQKFLYERSGNVLTIDKEYLLTTRLSPLMRTEDIHSLNQLAEELRKGEKLDLDRQVVELMLNNETSFFRDSHHFETLREVVLPSIIEQRASRRSISIWSAACASGQEPYSVAMTLKEHFPHEANVWNVEIYASDLSTRHLANAEAGRYSQMEVSRGLPNSLLGKYFRRDDASWQLDDKLREMVQFHELNLDEPPWPTMPLQDLILLRNVLIYFDQETKQKILHHATRMLNPGGYLWLGAAESMQNLDLGLDLTKTGKGSFFRVL